jgi:DNA-binding response OmpR family regulator
MAMFEQWPAELRHGRLHMNVRGLKVFWDDREVSLTLRQFEVLLYLLMHPHRVVTRDELKRSHWFTSVRPGRQGRVEEGARAVDVAICGIRRKLGANIIETVRGVGYRLAGTDRMAPASEERSHRGPSPEAPLRARL